MAALSSDQLITIARQHFEAGRIEPARDLCNLVLRDQPRRADAIALLQATKNPASAIEHYNRGNALLDEDRVDEAIEEYRQAIAIKPDFGQAYSNLGNAHGAKCEVTAAIAAYDQAICLLPDHPQPRWNLAPAALLVGDFENGWAGYEQRHRQLSSRPRTAPQWDGQDLADKTILLWAEQGLGDTIQFVRYFDKVARTAKHVLLEVPPEFRRLLSGSAEQSTSAETSVTYDFHSPLLSLPRIFKTNLQTIPCDVPYLQAPAALVDRWHAHLGARTSALRIGLAWAGRAEHQHDRHRSISLADLAPLFSIADVELHSLQRESTAEPIHPRPIVDHSSELTDFAETAALIANLDLVISVDTAVAHLAGAMGKPTWLLLAFAPDWRWQLNRGDSPWYPTMRLFRQTSPGAWSEPILAVATALATKACEEKG